MSPPVSESTCSNWSERAAMPQPRAGCAAGVIDGRLVVAGGTYWRDGEKGWSERVDAFDPVANGWESLPPLPRPCGDMASAVVADALFVFGGGAAGPTQASTWMLRGGTWSEVQAMLLPAPRRYAMAAVLQGRVFLLGGIEGAVTDFATARPTVWSAEPGKAWESRAAMPGPVRFGAAVAGVGDRILVAGGCTPENGSVRNLDEILAYDPASDRWSVVGRLPLPARGASPVVDGNRMVTFGGYTDRFEPTVLAITAAGNVTKVGELPVGLAGARFVTMGREVLGVSGENGIKMRFPGTIACTLPER